MRGVLPARSHGTACENTAICRRHYDELALLNIDFEYSHQWSAFVGVIQLEQEAGFDEAEQKSIVPGTCNDG